MTSTTSFENILISEAPTIAQALGGPLAGAAVQALGEAFGVSNPINHQSIATAAEQLPHPVAAAAAARADAAFSAAVDQLSSPASSGGASSATTHAGTTISPLQMIAMVILTFLGGFLVQRGYLTADVVNQIIGGVVGFLGLGVTVFHTLATNANTRAVTS